MFRLFWLISGVIALILGILGIFLPLLPTTPFVLLAALAFSRSSSTFYNLLIKSKIFGPIIVNWQENRTIPRKAKIISIIMMSVSIIGSLIYLM